MPNVPADELISQIADSLCEVDVKFLCKIADLVLSATHEPAGADIDGHDVIDQTWAK
jgi:hypothetical protein